MPMPELPRRIRLERETYLRVVDPRPADVAELLSNSFSFDKTAQGREYWMKIYNELKQMGEQRFIDNG